MQFTRYYKIAYSNQIQNQNVFIKILSLKGNLDGKIKVFIWFHKKSF